MPRSSRYRKVPILILMDKRGRLRRARALRLTVSTDGIFEHVLSENDRLDHLATKYYRQPRAWWHICDANPDYLSPLALIGNEPIYTDYFPLILADTKSVPQLDTVINKVRTLEGVEKVTLTHEVEIVPEKLPSTHLVMVEHFAWTLVVVYNATLLTAKEIGDAIQGAGPKVGASYRNRRVGKRIMIPPDSLG